MKLKKGDGYLHNTLYWIEYFHLFVDRSRVIQWGIGLYTLVVTVGLLFNSQSHSWGYAIAALVLPLSLINSFQAIVFFAHYFNIIANNQELTIGNVGPSDQKYQVSETDARDENGCQMIASM